MKEQIHINCDLGEGGAYDPELMPLISACNIACGGHSGNLDSMHRTVKLAMEHYVEIGAHPSYPDKKNFGRNSLKMEDETLQLSIEAQVLSLKQIVEAEGGKLTHVKLHGALYNDAAKDLHIAKQVIEALQKLDDNFVLYVPYKSKIAALAVGKFPLFFEAFADRNYNENYQLVSRSESEALITKKQAVFEHIFSMFREQKLYSKNGKILAMKADTFCLHSDTPSSVEILSFLHRKFAEQNIEIKQNK